MSISNLLVPNDYNLFANSLTVRQSIDVRTNQIYWNSYSVLATGNFVGPSGEATTYPNAQAVTNNQISITSLRVLLTAAPGVGESWTFTLYVNGSPTLLTVTISGASISAVNSSTQINLNPGNTFAVGMTSTAGAVADFAAICLDYI